MGQNFPPPPIIAINPLPHSFLILINKSLPAFTCIFDKNRYPNLLIFRLIRIMVLISEEQLNNAEKNSLWRPQLEKDACGVGFCASVKGIATHKVGY
jgi:hypothetical protein